MCNNVVYLESFKMNRKSLNMFVYCVIYYYFVFIMLWVDVIWSFLKLQHNLFFSLESQKKKSNNQDDSDEDEDDDDEAGPSVPQPAVVQPQQSYAAPMAQLVMPPVAGVPGMHPGAYQGKEP